MPRMTNAEKERCLKKLKEIEKAKFKPYAEKRIAELEKEVTRLRNENLDIINKYTRFAETDRKTIAELEAQIEKMKCCSNCDNWNWKHNKCEKKLKGDCFKASKWELRR